MKIKLSYTCTDDGCENILEEIIEADKAIKVQQVFCLKCAQRFPGFRSGNIFAPHMLCSMTKVD